MKAVIVKGTYHRQGVISQLVQSFVDGLKEARPYAEVRVIDLLDAEIGFCRGCGRCSGDDLTKPLGDCSVRDDDTREVLEEVVSSDILVLATPVYVMGPTALMKRLMERMLAMMKPGWMGIPTGRTPRRRDKVGVVLLSSGCPYPINALSGITRYPAGVLGRLARGAGCGTVLNLKAGGVEESERLRRTYNAKARALGRKAGLKATPAALEATAPR